MLLSRLHVPVCVRDRRGAEGVRHRHRGIIHVESEDRTISGRDTINVICLQNAERRRETFDVHCCFEHLRTGDFKLYKNVIVCKTMYSKGPWTMDLTKTDGSSARNDIIYEKVSHLGQRKEYKARSLKMAFFFVRDNHDFLSANQSITNVPIRFLTQSPYGHHSRTASFACLCKKKNYNPTFENAEMNVRNNCNERQSVHCKKWISARAKLDFLRITF